MPAFENQHKINRPVDQVLLNRAIEIASEQALASSAQNPQRRGRPMEGVEILTVDLDHRMSELAEGHRQGPGVRAPPVGPEKENQAMVGRRHTKNYTLF